MDDPSIGWREHEQALLGLARLNAVAGSARILWRPLADLARRRGAIRVLDIATGSGDVPLALARRATAHGLRIEWHACDASETALAVARERAQAAGIDLALCRMDALADALPQCDVVVCSLFLHHLADEPAARLLARMRDAAACAVLVADLRRSRAGLVLALLAARVLTSSHVVHTDAQRSVRAAFIPRELATLARRAGLDGATVRPCWPQRMLLEWRRA